MKILFKSIKADRSNELQTKIRHLLRIWCKYCRFSGSCRIIFKAHTGGGKSALEWPRG